jgi:tetratricopeptide (TPR) repeat protein
MKNLKLSSAVLLLAAISLTLIATRRSPLTSTYINSKPAYLPITMCGVKFADDSDTTLGSPKIFSGLGKLQYRVTTKSPEAQEFFDQGLKLVYNFNHWEAIQSFRHAVRLDPQFAMGYWGLALAYGPNLNDGSPAQRERFAFEAINNAKKYSSAIPQVEKDLIDAMSKRYDGKIHKVRDTLNQAYADAMVLVGKKYPGDSEVQTMCADAIMNTMPWDYWQSDGTPKPATTEAKTVLDLILKKYPNHPGANHLYIHLLEASPNPGLALNSARVLENAMPAAGHLVHMPSHIYVRVGEYGKSIVQNQLAAKADEDYLSASENTGMYRWGYYPHNVDFIVYSSYMQGRSELAIQTAMKLAYKGTLMLSSNPTIAQYFTSEPMYAFLRFGKWNDVLSLPIPDDRYIYSRAISHFSRGLAFARTKKIANAQIEFNKLDSISKLDTLKSIYFSLNQAGVILKIPTEILRGELLLLQNRKDEAFAALTKAVEFEKDLRYNEPPDWKLHARQFLGAALLENGKLSEAEKVYQEDLKANPGNIWSLSGLLQCQQKLNNRIGVEQTQKQLATSTAGADVKISSSRL